MCCYASGVSLLLHTNEGPRPLMAKIILLENLRALFYAPFYIAHARGMFAEEGVEVSLEESHSPLDTAARAIAGASS